MLQKILKEKTQTLHDELEHLMFVTEIMNKTLSLDQYKKNIVINYAVHKQLENQLFEAVSDELQSKLNLGSRKKLPALEKDINELNIEEGEVLWQSNAEPEVLENDAFILGALYVLEGATLGGHVIAKNLATNPNFVHQNIPVHYYSVYGEDLMNNWKSFVAVLNEVSEEHYHFAVNGAIMMFEKMIATAQIYHQHKKTAV
jgi:heme oxygenase